jgi:capsular polysaccharide biosynthesis protein
MARHGEGVVFAEDGGICNEAGYLAGFGHGGQRTLPMPAGMRCDHHRLFVDRDVLAQAPLLHGPHVVFTPGTLTNYTHWLLEGILPLHVLRDHVPPDARFLIPATLRHMRHEKPRICDHHDILRAFGYSGVPAVEVADAFVKVEEIYYIQETNVFHMPAEHLQQLRAHIARLRPMPAQGGRHVYVARRGTRRIANQAALEPFLANQGFETYFLEDLSIDEQIDLFAGASWVIGPHGAELGNLLFCKPGTKILELSPDADFKPFFSYMCNKLGLVHGVLPCPTTTGGFNGDIIIDMHKFTALFRMLKHRL